MVCHFQPPQTLLLLYSEFQLVWLANNNIYIYKLMTDLYVRAAGASFAH